MSQSAPRVLIADDEPHIRSVIRSIVTSLGGMVIIEAADGDQALQGFLESYPDVVILDINMPRLTGDVALAEMIARKPGIVAIMMTAQDTISTVRDCLDIGARDYLLKSNSAEEIYRLMRQAWIQNVADIDALEAA